MSPLKQRLDDRFGMGHQDFVNIRKPYSITKCRQFFAEPATTRQRQYEALRAFYLEGQSSAEAARRFGYTSGSFRGLCHSFRRGELGEFFTTNRPGPREQPKKNATRDQIIALRKRNRHQPDAQGIRNPAQCHGCSRGSCRRGLCSLAATP